LIKRMYPDNELNPLHERKMTIERGKKKLLIPIILLAIVPVVMFAAGFALGEEKQAQESSNTVIVGTELDYPPYSFLDEDGRPAGFNVDLTRAIAKKMDLKIAIEIKPWSEIRLGLKTGKISVISGIYYSKKRAESVDFFSTLHHRPSRCICPSRCSGHQN
jgi:ABC-type amino acid transport substrate-binding protein